MKSTKKPLPMEAPQSLIDKLKLYAKEHLTDNERTDLNTVFSVFSYAMKYKEDAFKEQPDFLKTIMNSVAHMEKSNITTETI